MSFNRTIYDKCNENNNNYYNTNAFDYMMYQGKYYNDKKCRVEFGLLGGTNVGSYKGNLVDLESQLRGQTTQLSKCQKPIPSEKNYSFTSLSTCKFPNPQKSLEILSLPKQNCNYKAP